MKTQPLREDKHCLNCGTEVPERYCTHCGQENAVPHESFGHLIKHFIGDVVHYDSQFFKTLKYLLFKPGRLTREYMAGKRVAYVNPIKLYIFISFVFFLTLALISHKPGDHDSAQAAADTTSTHTEPGKVKENASLTDILSIVRDSLENNLGEKGIGQDPALNDSTELTTAIRKARQQRTYHTVAEYDSVQQSLPPDKRDGTAERWLTRRVIHIEGSYKDGYFTETFKHNVPKMMFVLMPLFALWLKLMYNWKRWYYTDHAIFALHVHCFAFVLLLATLLLDHFFDTDAFTSWGILLLFVYLWLALRHTYQQSYRRSFFKAMLLITGYSISFAFVFAFFVILVFAVIL